MYWLGQILKLLVYLIYISPKWLRYSLAWCLGILWFDILRIRRRLIFENLNRVFPKLSRRDKAALARQSIIYMGLNVVEMCDIPFLDANYLKKFEFLGEEHLQAAMQKDKGMCVLTLHLGNYDLATAALALYGYPLTVISKEFKLRWLNQIWFRVRRRVGTKFIPPRNSSYAILKAIKNKERVGFVLDQFMGPPIGVQTKFFGHETGTALGLSLIVARTKVPVVPVYCYRQGDKHVIQALPEVLWEDQRTHDESLAYMTQKYSDILEEIIMQHPDQWMWVHNRWKVFVWKRKPSEIRYIPDRA